MAKRYQIELNEQEQTLVDQIIFDLTSHQDYRKVYLQNQEIVPALYKSLEKRNAILNHRLAYWQDPAYQTDRRLKISHKGIFERNGTVGNDIYQHLHFLNYLYYFIYGPNLPDELIEMFEQEFTKAGLDVEYFTSGDHEPLWKLSRKIGRIAVREYGMSKHQVAIEMFKMCLEIGLTLDRYSSAAKYVYREVSTMRV